jgi:pimeloyl-ACP methyl ester carboxylesterase
MLTSRSVGAFRTGEVSVLALGRCARPDNSRYGAIFCPGYQGNADVYYQPVYNGPVHALAESGTPCLMADHGGNSTWGNDTAMAAMDAAYTYLTTTGGAKPGKVFLSGGSMGTLTMLNWAKRNPTKVAGIACALPAVSLTDLHDNRYVDAPGTTNPVRALVETAYGGATAYAAAVGTHDPNLTPGAFTGIPMKLYYSTDDPVALPSIALAFAAAVGSSCKVASLGARGHNADNLDPVDIAEFARSLVA